MYAINREELIQLAEQFTKESDPEKLVQLSKQILAALDRVQEERNKSMSLT